MNKNTRLALIRSFFSARRAASLAVMAAAGISPAPAAQAMPRVWVAKKSPVEQTNPAEMLPADFVPAPVPEYRPLIAEIDPAFVKGVDAFLADCNRANGGDAVQCLLLTA